MKLNRRRAMMAAIGGAMAGPSALQAAGESYMPPLPQVPSYSGAKTTLDSPTSVMDELARAKRIAAGDIRDEDRNYPTEGPPQPFSALRSVSDHARIFMRGRHWERQWRERAIAAAQDTLKHYDQTGLLRHFF